VGSDLDGPADGGWGRGEGRKKEGGHGRTEHKKDLRRVGRMTATPNVVGPPLPLHCKKKVLEEGLRARDNKEVGGERGQIQADAGRTQVIASSHGKGTGDGIRKL